MASEAGGGSALSLKYTAAIVVGVAVVASAAWFGTGDDAPVPEVSAPIVEDAPPSELVENDEAPTVDDQAEIEEPVLTPPSFDQIRVAPDGATVVAGQAPSQSGVTLFLDGEEVAQTRSTGAGEFAAILTIEPSTEPRIMSLLAIAADGTEVPGAETVIIAPFGTIDATEDQVAALETEAVEAPRDTAALPQPEGLADGQAPEAAEDAPAEADIADLRAEPAGTADLSDGATEDLAAATETTDAATEAPTELADAEAATSTDDAAEATEPAVTEAPTQLAEADATPSADETTEVTELAAAGTAETPTAEPTTPTSNETAAATGDSAPETTGSEDAAPTIVVAGTDGVRVVRGGAPEAQTEVQIDAISYTIDGDVAVSGRGPADRQVQVLLNNQPIQLGEIGPEGQWSLELPDVDPGTYTLTVTQLSPSGEVESRVDTPFLREDPDLIAGSPMRVEDGVSVITVQPGFTLWGIAEANFGDGIAYVQIFQENRDRIRDPDLIFPGQIFQLPDLPRDAVVE